MHSALFTGTVRHRRFAPTAHDFEYRLTLAYIDLAELDRVFAGRWLWSTSKPTVAWLRRADYLGDAAVPLDVAVRDRVERELGERPRGPIRLLTHLRTFGHCFNPVSFYYCFDEKDERVVAVVAEITNTPWNERHAYVLEPSQPRVRFPKTFHVSPFMPMDMDYDWTFTPPGERLLVHMANWRGGDRVFDATLRLDRVEITAASLAAALARFPFACARVLAAIYWQALRLWMKRVPFHPHPT